MTEKRHDAPSGTLAHLADVHRGWCNYCKGNVEWCRAAPPGGCSLRDYENALASVSEIETTQILGGAPGPIVVYSESKAESQPAAEGTPRPYCWVIEWENGKQDFVDGDPDLCNSKSVSKPLYEAHIALVEVLPCKHPFSLLVKSVESNYSFCELCEMRKMRDDAEEMERVNLQRAEAAESRLSALEADAQNMVPRSRYDACNSDWLAAKAEVEKKQALLTQVGKWIEQYPTTREVIDAMSRDCAARAERKEQSNGQG